MKIEQDTKLDFNNVLIRPKRSTLSSRSQVDLTRTFEFPNSKQTWHGIPIIAANMDTTGVFKVYDVFSKHKVITALHKHYTLADYQKAMTDRMERGEPLNPDYFMVSTGISDENFETMSSIVNAVNAKWICIDIANGYMEKFVSFCRRVRDTFPDKILVAGNVVSREMVEELILRGGVDVVKVGIGPGSACLTRMKTGVGMPQLSAIMECADAAHGVGGYIIGDGGITCPGDMAKAFGGGADFVMCGGVFAGHDENPGDVTYENGQRYKIFYGMSSDFAQNKHYNGMASYRSSEGRVVKVKYRGSIEETLMDYLGGLRSCCTYINAKCIKHIPKCTTFVLVNQQLNTSLA